MEHKNGMDGELIFENDGRWPENTDMTTDERLALKRHMESFIDDIADPALQLTFKKFWKKFHDLELYHLITRYQWSIGEDPNNPEAPFQLDPVK
jgi:hypothetical protein